MVEGLLREKEESLVSKGQTPYISYSRINRYLQCPEQYRLYYIENLRPSIPLQASYLARWSINRWLFYFKKKKTRFKSLTRLGSR